MGSVCYWRLQIPNPLIPMLSNTMNWIRNMLVPKMTALHCTISSPPCGLRQWCRIVFFPPVGPQWTGNGPDYNHTQLWQHNTTYTVNHCVSSAWCNVLPHDLMCLRTIIPFVQFVRSPFPAPSASKLVLRTQTFGLGKKTKYECAKKSCQKIAHSNFPSTIQKRRSSAYITRGCS